MTTDPQPEAIDQSLRVVTVDEYLVDTSPLADSPFKPNKTWRRVVLLVKRWLVRLAERVVGARLYCENPLQEFRALDPVTRVTLINLVERGIIKNWTFNAYEGGGISVPFLQMTLSSTVIPITNHRVVTGGVGMSLSETVKPAFGELIERYSLYQWDTMQLTLDNFAGLKEKSVPAVDPVKLFTFTEKNTHLNKRVPSPEQLENTQMHWTRGKNFLDNTATLLPAAAVYTGFRFVYSTEPFFFEVTSNGAAAYTDQETALYKAVTEAIERDTFLGYWLHKIVPDRISQKSITERFPDLDRWINRAEQHGYTLHLLHLTNEFMLPVILGIVVDEHRRSVVVGTAAGHDIYDLLWKTIFGCFRLIQDTQTEKPTEKESSKGDSCWDVHNIDDRINLWRDGRMLTYAEWMWSGKEIAVDEVIAIARPEEETQEHLNRLRRTFSESEYEAYWIDMTTPLATEIGLRVVRFVAPDLLPMYFNEHHTPYGIARLYDFPVRIGVQDYPAELADLNSVPHPFA